MDLAETLRGEVRFDRGAQAMYAERQGPTEGTEVLLWPDTFTNYFTPGIAAAGVLEDADCRSPYRSGPCARPLLYDYGMLPTAKRWLRRILAELREPILRRQPRPRRPRTHRKAAAKIVCELQGTD